MHLTTVFISLFCAVINVCECHLYAFSYKQQGWVPTRSGIVETISETVTKCLMECHAVECMSAFYHSKHRECRLYDARPHDLELDKTSGWITYHREGEITVWATHLVAVSSSYTEEGQNKWSGEQALRLPNVYPKYKDSEYAWASGARSLPNEWIQLEFPEISNIKEVHIYEVYHAGGVKQISGRRVDGGWDTLFETNNIQDIKRSRIFKPVLKRPYMKTDVIRITVDGTVCESWPEIDAVKVVGDYMAY